MYIRRNLCCFEKNSFCLNAYTLVLLLFCNINFVQASDRTNADLDISILSFTQNGQFDSLAIAYEKKAISYEEHSLNAAIIYYEKALDIYYVLSQYESVIRLHNLLALLYEELEQYNEALVHAYKSLSGHQQLGDSLGLAYAHSLVGSIYGGLLNVDQSFTHHKKAFRIVVGLNHKEGIAATTHNLASLYGERDSMDLAFHYLKQSEFINKELGNDYWLSVNYMLYSDFYSAIAEYDSARYYLFRSQEYTKSFGSLHDSIMLFKKLGMYYYAVDSTYEAINYFKGGVDLSEQLGSYDTELFFSNWLFDTYEKDGDITQAFSQLKLLLALRDSVYNEEAIKNKEELRVLYDVGGLENDLNQSLIEKKTAELEIEKNWIWIAGLLLISGLLLTFGIIFLLQYRKQYRSNRYLLKLNIELTNQTKKAKKKYAESPLTDDRKDDILEQFVDLIIEQELFKDQNLKLETVAKSLNVGRTYLSQVINESFSQNFNSYINNCRINLAKEYLLAPEYNIYSIKGISETVGFKSLNTFNSSFKKFTGLTPSFYRNNGATPV